MSISNDDNDTKETEIIASSNLPVLIIPGFMSSSLEVVKSGISKKYEGDSVWMNPLSLGFGGLYIGRSMENKKVKAIEGGQRDHSAHSPRKESSKGKGNSNDDLNSLEMDKYTDIIDNSDDADSVVNLDDSVINVDKVEGLGRKAPISMTDKKYKEEVKCKNTWLHHISLTKDAMTERRGNEIRAVSGLNGCDYLTKFMNKDVGASYVFGHVIKALEIAGYTKGVDLDAATYDWRMTPGMLEKRDKYFTTTMDRIERMYKECDNGPVVLLCHSLGAKVGHYLLNFAKDRRGQAWVDTHIHTYLPVGGVHAGAPVAVGNALVGVSIDPMIDPILSTEERIMFARNLGVGPWLIPRQLPSNVAAFPNIMYLREGCLELKISRVGDLNKLAENKLGIRNLNDISLSVSFGGSQPIHSRLVKPEESEEGLHVKISETFLFSTPPTLDNGLKNVRFFLNEKGSKSAKFREKRNEDKHKKDKDKNDKLKNKDKAEQKDWKSDFYKFVCKSTDIVATTTQNAVHFAVDTAAGGTAANSRILAYSHEHDIPTKNILPSNDYKTEFPVAFVARADTRSLTGKIFGKKVKENRRTIDAIVQVRWIPPLSEKNEDPPKASKLPKSIMKLPSFKGKKGATDYVPFSAQTVIHGMHDPGADSSILIDNQYENDPLGPRTMSALEAPPVKRVYAVYGINCPTDVGYAICRPSGVVQKEGRVKPSFVLDTNVRTENADGYTINKGRILETRDTPQKNWSSGQTVHCSGDGTVPYWSLSVPQQWLSQSCDVRMKEIEGKGPFHRDILGDQRFHRTLLEYLGGQAIIEKYEAQAIEMIQRYVRRWRLKKQGKIALVDVVESVALANINKHK